MVALLAWLRRASDWAWAIGLIAVAVGTAYLRDRWRRQGRREAEQEALQDANERVEKGREAVQDGRDSGLSPDERVRRNDAAW